MKKHAVTISAVLVLLLMGFTVSAAQAPDKPAKEKAATKAAKNPDKPVDINNATEKELTTLPGVGPKIAKEIVAARPFQSIDDIKKVKGIGDKTFSLMKPHLVCNPPKK